MFYFCHYCSVPFGDKQQDKIKVLWIKSFFVMNFSYLISYLSLQVYESVKNCTCNKYFSLTLENAIFLVCIIVYEASLLSTT